VKVIILIVILIWTFLAYLTFKIKSNGEVLIDLLKAFMVIAAIISWIIYLLMLTGLINLID
jgi:hypothetical protein